MIYGVVCLFGCYVGYELIGGILEIICKDLGEWLNIFF